MSTALHLARPDDLARLLPLVEACHSEAGILLDDAARMAAVAPLLEGTPLGAVYLIGPARAPVGYVVLAFGWSVELGGMDAYVDELYIRPPVRRRGMGSDALTALGGALGEAGVRAFHLKADETSPEIRAFYQRAGFAPRGGYMLVTRKL
ncbi:GNAT family N-acetyltransferase [Shimia sp.]|uniref:GNAT family N-acetyltransferase n=1 Tax=Shimia sp. TaxID=1954381 RepID=UPI0035659F4A